MNTAMIITLVAFLFVAVCLLTNKIPGSVACGLAVMVLWITGVIDTNQAFSNFISSNIICMIGMMIVTAGLMKTDILRNIAGLVKKFNGGMFLLLFASMFVPFILGQFIGGVTAMITVIPLAMALADEADVPATLVVLPASAGAQAGLMGLPIGNAATMYLQKNDMIANLNGTEMMGFWDLCLARLPGTIMIFIFVLVVGWKLLPKRGLADSDALQNGGMSGLKVSELSKQRQYLMYAIFIATMILMSICNKIGLQNTHIAVGAALLTMLCRFLKEREAYQSVNWPLVFMMGFILAITTALGNSGAGEVLANLLKPIYGSGNMALACGVTFVFCVILTQFMDNMSLINIITPIAIVACMQSGISCLPIIAAIDASCLASFSTPLASPSSLLAYQLGGYSMKEMFKFNIPLVIIATIVSVIWIPFYFTVFH